MVKAVLLGTAQDGGRPQPGCRRPCCAQATPADTRYPVSWGLIDDEGRGHLVEATRALGEQLHLFGHPPLASVLLTHAHFGHVDGLGLFGRETLNASGLALYASETMLNLVQQTPQWALMVEQGVFVPTRFCKGDPVVLSGNLSVEPVLVPHRAELSDMHALVIRGPNRSLLFLPDHDRWEDTLAHHGQPSVRSWFASLKVDIALIDGTFWSANELEGRSQHDVPHPPVSETLEHLGQREDDDPEVVFIHLNHTNPLHDVQSKEHHAVEAFGWMVGQQGMTFNL
jgi:pyrroloquinoline quinone biosynthesis protein B